MRCDYVATEAAKRSVQRNAHVSAQALQGTRRPCTLLAHA